MAKKTVKKMSDYKLTYQNHCNNQMETIFPATNDKNARNFVKRFIRRQRRGWSEEGKRNVEAVQLAKIIPLKK